jgi:hypothetical protein
MTRSDLELTAHALNVRIRTAEVRDLCKMTRALSNMMDCIMQMALIEHGPHCEAGEEFPEQLN